MKRETHERPAYRVVPTPRADRGQIVITVLIVLAVLAVLAGAFFGLPTWNVWRQGLSGEAALRRATQERQILVQQAQAERDAAELRAEAIGIVGQAAKDFPEYRYQEFLGAFAEALNSGAIDQIIYVPTEANMPITEARRLSEAP